jgi:methionyl aminopeptidase
MIIIKSKKEIDLIRISCAIVREVLEKVAEYVKPGITTKSIDKLAESIIISRSATPSFKNYRGFPSTICASINDEVVHGIPSERTLKEGDILSVDVGAYKNGFHGDAARTYLIGNCSADAKRLVKVTEESFFEGLKFASEGNRLTNISHAIQKHVESHGFGVVRDFYGHGIGRDLHEEPSIPHYGKPNRGAKLRAGMVLAIEPMVTMGDYAVKTLEDGWTAVTVDGSLAAHYENTVVITHGEPEILTL